MKTNGFLTTTLTLLLLCSTAAADGRALIDIPVDAGEAKLVRTADEGVIPSGELAGSVLAALRATERPLAWMECIRRAAGHLRAEPDAAARGRAAAELLARMDMRAARRDGRRALRLLGLGWAVELLGQAGLADAETLRGYRPGADYLRDAAAAAPWGAVRLARAVTTVGDEQAAHLAAAVDAAPRGSLLERNLINFFGADRIDEVRARSTR